MSLRTANEIILIILEMIHSADYAREVYAVRNANKILSTVFFVC